MTRPTKERIEEIRKQVPCTAEYPCPDCKLSLELLGYIDALRAENEKLKADFHRECKICDTWLDKLKSVNLERDRLKKQRDVLRDAAEKIANDKEAFNTEMKYSTCSIASVASRALAEVQKMEEDK